MSETRTLVFYGASDDLFEVEGSRGDEPDEIGCFGHIPVVKVVTPAGEGMIVLGVYNSDDLPVAYPACWAIGVAPLDEDVPIPAWPISIALGGRGYSAALTLTAPADAVVTVVAG
jgi:hypothetical protein